MKKSVLEKIRMRGLKKKLEETIDEKHDSITSQARLKWADRWMARTEEVTGKPCTEWEDIKFDD